MAPPSLTSSLDDAQDSAPDTSHFLAKIHFPWKLFPANSYNDLLRNHGKENVKVIHVVRHAEGTHNVLENYGDPTNFDARLTPKGKEQCARLAQNVKETIPELVGNVEDIGVITSPMTRCVQTALYSFPWLTATDSGVPFLAHECIRETVNYICDRRRTVSEIAQEFPRVDFALCDKDKDFIWDDYRNRLPDEWDKQMESGELNAVANRALEAFGVLQERPEHHLIVCSHSGKTSLLLVWKIDVIGSISH
jgi:broad specificity phosphatase PhoE